MKSEHALSPNSLAVRGLNAERSSCHAIAKHIPAARGQTLCSRDTAGISPLSTDLPEISNIIFHLALVFITINISEGLTYCNLLNLISAM